jgi:hypothetical protein
MFNMTLTYIYPIGVYSLTLTVRLLPIFTFLFFIGATAHIGPWPLQQFVSRYPYPLPISSILLCSAAATSPS